MLRWAELVRLSVAGAGTLTTCSSPPNVCIFGAGERSGRRGACLGIDSRWRRSSSSRSCSFIFLLTLPLELLRSESGSVDFERRKKPREDLREAASELATLKRVVLSLADEEGTASGGGGGGGGREEGRGGWLLLDWTAAMLCLRKGRSELSCLGFLFGAGNTVSRSDNLN